MRLLLVPILTTSVCANHLVTKYQELSLTSFPKRPLLEASMEVVARQTTSQLNIEPSLRDDTDALVA